MKFVKLKNELMREIWSNIDPNYLFVEVVNPETQIDITNLESINEFGLLSGRDYLFVRDFIISIINGKGGFDPLNDSEKRIAALWVTTTKINCLSILSEDEYNDAVDNYGTQAYISRNTRKELAAKKFRREVIKGDLSYEDINQLWIDSKDLLNNWIESANPAFIHWINSSYEYTNNGFAEKYYYTPERKAYLVNHIIKGEII